MQTTELGGKSGGLSMVYSYIHHATCKRKAGSLKFSKVTSDNAWLSAHAPHACPTMLCILLVLDCTSSHVCTCTGAQAHTCLRMYVCRLLAKAHTKMPMKNEHRIVCKSRSRQHSCNKIRNRYVHILVTQIMQHPNNCQPLSPWPLHAT